MLPRRTIVCVRLAVVVLALIAVTVLPFASSADGTADWRGEYYNNVNLTGSPVLVRTDSQVNFDWGSSSPGTGVEADRFGVRWTAFISFGGGNYVFNATTDDGVRVWVDEQLIIDRWYDQPETTHSVAKYLSGGYHSLRVEHYENTGRAVCKVWWTLEGGGGSPSPTPGDWRAEYYGNTYLGGSPIIARDESTIYYDWGYGSPASAVPSDYFSARWTRDVYFDSSTNYTFSATVDDGVRVWVDGVLVIDKWYPQSRTTHSGTTYVSAGTHQVKVEYFERTGVAVCMVSWAGGGTSTPPSTATTVIVDDLDTGFIWGGPSSRMYGRSTGYSGHLYWSWNGYAQLGNWAKWSPNLPNAGDWEAYIYIPSKYHGSKSARYTVRHNGMSHEVVVNQNIYYDKWVSLGTYYFAGTSDEYVYLGDATGEVAGTRYVGFDAVKFVYRGGGTPSQPTPSGCAITPAGGFGTIWSGNSAVRAKIGCPTANEQGVWMGEETFQGGYMFWRQDQNMIYVLYNNGTWASYADTWTSAEPEWDTMIFPPSGYYQPKRGFGKVWRNESGVRDNLQWATTEERGFFGTLQTYDGGMMLWSNLRGVFVLYNDNTWTR